MICSMPTAVRKNALRRCMSCAGGNRIKVEELQAGDIGAMVKLKDVKTGNTLNGKDCDYKFNFHQISEFKIFTCHQAL
jgi:translation elongation factor EF-G